MIWTRHWHGHAKNTDVVTDVVTDAVTDAIMDTNEVTTTNTGLTMNSNANTETERTRTLTWRQSRHGHRLCRDGTFGRLRRPILLCLAFSGRHSVVVHSLWQRLKHGTAYRPMSHHLHRWRLSSAVSRLSCSWDRTLKPDIRWCSTSLFWLCYVPSKSKLIYVTLIIFVIIIIITVTEPDTVTNTVTENTDTDNDKYTDTHTGTVNDTNIALTWTHQEHRRCHGRGHGRKRVHGRERRHGYRYAQWHGHCIGSHYCWLLL